MEREAKAKVVVSVWGAKLFQFLSAARNCTNFAPPPNRRDDLCLGFCPHPSMTITIHESSSSSSLNDDQCCGAGPILTNSSSCSQLRLPAPENKSFYSNLNKTYGFEKQFYFLKSVLIFISICVKIVIIWLKLLELSQVCHHRTPKSHSTLYLYLYSEPVQMLRLHNTAIIK